MFPAVSEESSPVRLFVTRAEAQVEADRISNTPRCGKASAQYVGARDSWIVEVRPRANPYGNPGVLRADGTIAKYPY